MDPGVIHQDYRMTIQEDEKVTELLSNIHGESTDPFGFRLVYLHSS